MTVVEEKIGGDSEAIVCSKIGPLEKLLQVSCFVWQFVLNLKTKEMGSQGEMEKCDVLQLRYEQRILGQGDNFEKVRHSLNVIYDEHFLLRSKNKIY